VVTAKGKITPQMSITTFKKEIIKVDNPRVIYAAYDYAPTGDNDIELRENDPYLLQKLDYPWEGWCQVLALHYPEDGMGNEEGEKEKRRKRKGWRAVRKVKAEDIFYFYCFILFYFIILFCMIFLFLFLFFFKNQQIRMCLSKVQRKAVLPLIISTSIHNKNNFFIFFYFNFFITFFFLFFFYLVFIQRLL
jgi:hypothetical protein